MEQFLSTKRASALLKCSPITLRRRAKRGALKTIEGIKMLLFYRKEIEKLPPIRRGRPLKVKK